MILDPAHQPITVRAWSQVLVWDTAVPMEEERGHWAGGQRARREASEERAEPSPARRAGSLGRMGCTQEGQRSPWKSIV